MNNYLDKIIKCYISDKYTIKKVNKGYACEKWIVNSSNNIFLKEIKNISDNRLMFINFVQDSLKEYSPNIIKTKTGDLYIKTKDSFYVAYEFVDGSSVTKNELEIDDCFNIGRFLGKIHKNMKSLTIPNEFTECTCLKINDNFSKIPDLLSAYNEQDEFKKILKYKMHILTKIKKKDIMDILRILSKQLVHGDFYLDNIIKTDSKYIISDFDQVGIFYKMYEVMRAIMMIVYDNSNTNEQNIERIVKFLEGYKMEDTIENMKSSIDLYIYTLANSLYCLKPEDYYIQNKKDFACERCEMLTWIFQNKQKILSEIKRSEL